jgi:hypothetical protein
MGTSLELSNQTQTGNWLGGRSELTWITGLSVNHFRERKREIGHEKRNPPIREVAARTQIYAPHRIARKGEQRKAGAWRVTRGRPLPLSGQTRPLRCVVDSHGTRVRTQGGTAQQGEAVRGLDPGIRAM